MHIENVDVWRSRACNRGWLSLHPRYHGLSVSPPPPPVWFQLLIKEQVNKLQGCDRIAGGVSLLKIWAQKKWQPTWCVVHLVAKQKLMMLNSRSVHVILSNIAAWNVRKIIGRSTKKHARNGWLKWGTINYLGNPIRAILVNVQSAVCQTHSTWVNRRLWHVAAK